MKTFTISPFTNPSGNTVYRVQGTLNGKRIRENHPDQSTALTAKQNYERQAANLAPLPAITTRLTASEAQEAEAAFHRLKGETLTLTKAVDYALKNYSASVKTITVQAAYNAFVQSKHQENARPDTIRNLTRLSRFVSMLGDLQVNEVQADALRPFIFDKGSKLNQRNQHAMFTNFFNWCVMNKYAAVSPMDTIGAIKIDRKRPEILTMRQVYSLVRAARDYKDGVCLPYVILGLFCAIRPKEISRVTWDNVNLHTNTVSVDGKLRAMRTVSISLNAMRWLEIEANEFGDHKPLFPANWRKDFAAVRKLAGITTWPQDVMRHTGITHHFALHQDEGKTARWAGNSPDVIHGYYKGRVNDPKDTTDFWAITPESLNNITTLNQQVA